MRRKRLVLRSLFVSALMCTVLSLCGLMKGRLPEEYRWLAEPIANAAHWVGTTLLILWGVMRRMPGDKLLLDRGEVAILRRGPWWFVFSVMGVVGVAIWIGTWASWWAGQRYSIP